MRRFVQKQLKNFISGILLQMLHQTYFEIKLKIAPVTTIEESTNSKLNGMQCYMKSKENLEAFMNPILW